jgi:hypothetical protein
MWIPPFWQPIAKDNLSGDQAKSEMGHGSELYELIGMVVEDDGGVIEGVRCCVGIVVADVQPVSQKMIIAIKYFGIHEFFDLFIIPLHGLVYYPAKESAYKLN